MSGTPQGSKGARELILGLDISTSCTGAVIIDQAGDIVSWEWIDLSKKKSMWDKATVVESHLQKLAAIYKVDRVFVEQNLTKFRRGQSSAQVLLKLGRFNGIVSFLAARAFEVSPISINVNEARRAVGIKIDRKDKTKDTKEKVFEQAQLLIARPELWKMKLLKSGPRAGQEVFDPRNYDAMDAWVVARSGQLLNITAPTD